MRVEGEGEGEVERITLPLVYMLTAIIIWKELKSTLHQDEAVVRHAEVLSSPSTANLAEHVALSPPD